MSSSFLNSDTDGTAVPPEQARSLLSKAKGRAERFLRGTEHSLESPSLGLPSTTIQTYPPEARRQRVVLLAANSVDHDTRVKKTAASLRSAGYSVGILGITREGISHSYQDPGLVRAPYVQLRIPDLRFIARRIKVLSHRFCVLYPRKIWQLIRNSTQYEPSYNGIVDSRVQEMAPAKAGTQSKPSVTQSDAAIAIANNVRSLLANHDRLLHGLSSEQSLLKKLGIIARQEFTIRKNLRELRKEILNNKDIDTYHRKYISKHHVRISTVSSGFRRYFSPLAGYINYYRSTKNYLKAFKPDVIHANDLHTLPAAIRYRDKYAPYALVIYDSHEFEMHRNKEYNFARNITDQIIEWYCIRKADHVITVSEGIADALAHSYNIPRPSVVLNSPSTWHGDLSNGERLKKKIGLSEESVLIVYTGTVTFGRGLEILVSSLKHLPKQYHIAILGPRRHDKDAGLQDIAIQNNVADRMHLVPPVTPQDVPALISDADLFINPAQNVCLSYDLALPNKLFDAVFAHVPILVGDLTEMKQFVNTTQAGISRVMTNPEETAAAILEAIDLKRRGYFDKVEWSRIAHTYSWDVQARRLIEIYGSILSAR